MPTRFRGAPSSRRIRRRPSDYPNPTAHPGPTPASTSTISVRWTTIRTSIETHGGYANYNSLQVSAQKQSGNLFLFTNFTFGKVLGTRDGIHSNGNGNGPVVNPFNLGANYGPLGYDHTKVFNFSAATSCPSPFTITRSWAKSSTAGSSATTPPMKMASPYQTTRPI